ncbi:unnamed protein product [Thelazia callipaeda]|uniref:Uncharacterized protein n=1 Tax=Thelazia callipaeda TaxID=103827 RepID=A0A158RAM3_THECL|nr:unnamed protein product [Thelazia callipaeda]
MLFTIFLLSTLNFFISTAQQEPLPEPNKPNTTKNEAGAAYWYPPPAVSNFQSFPSAYNLPGYFQVQPSYSSPSCPQTPPPLMDRKFLNLAMSDPSSRLTREFCRYAAATSETSCNTCCKIAARHHATAIDEVRGITFSFDPKMPPIAMNSMIRKKRDQPTTSETSTQSSYPPAFLTKTRRLTPSPASLGLASVTGNMRTQNNIAQCFCCAPVKSVYSF